jgi:arginyl-tRNA synthetase
MLNDFKGKGISLEDHLTEIFTEKGAILGIPSDLCKVVYSNKGADFQCNGAFASAKILKKSPLKIAQDWVELFSGDDSVVVEVAGSGFINIWVSGELLSSYCNEALLDEDLLVAKTHSPKKIVFDFGGYNAAKQLHVGHLKSTIIGDTLSKIYKFFGDEVVTDVHLGDWGLQMGLLIEAVKEKHPEWPYFGEGGDFDCPLTIGDLNELYPQASLKSKSDADFHAKASLATKALQSGDVGYTALWEHFVEVSIDSIKKDITKFGVDFDLWNGESTTQVIINDLVEDLVDTGLAHESDGALIVPVSGSAPLILQKGDGGFTYATSDLANIFLHEVDGAEEIYYVVGSPQQLHFKQVFSVAQAYGLKPKCTHIKFGSICGSDGKAFKTKAGGTVKLSEVYSEVLKSAQEKSPNLETAHKVAVAAIKFGDLINHLESDYILDLESICSFEGKTGPYLQYSACKIKSILSKASGIGLVGDEISISSVSEKKLALELSKFPTVLKQVKEKNTPHLLCEHLFKVGQAFGTFYHSCNILKEKSGSKLSLACLTLETLELGLSLLGIEIPDQL